MHHHSGTFVFRSHNVPTFFKLSSLLWKLLQRTCFTDFSWKTTTTKFKLKVIFRCVRGLYLFQNEAPDFDDINCGWFVVHSIVIINKHRNRFLQFCFIPSLLTSLRKHSMKPNFIFKVHSLSAVNWCIRYLSILDKLGSISSKNSKVWHLHRNVWICCQHIFAVLSCIFATGGCICLRFLHPACRFFRCKHTKLFSAACFNCSMLKSNFYVFSCGFMLISKHCVIVWSSMLSVQARISCTFSSTLSWNIWDHSQFPCHLRLEHLTHHGKQWWRRW